MLTQKYKNGFITLNAEKFSPVTQETIDREIKNFEPMKRGMTYEQTIEIITNAIQKDEMTVERDMALAIIQKTLKKQIPKKIEFDGNKLICPNCGNGADILFGDKYCVECGQHLDWSWAIQ